MFTDIIFPWELSEIISVPAITGLAAISFNAKLLMSEVLETFSDHIGRPSSYIKDIRSPLLNGAIIIFSYATGDAVKRFFLLSSIVWNVHSILPFSKFNE